MLNGRGGEKDPVGVFKLVEKAALQGLHSDADAMGNLGGMYFAGVGTPVDVIEGYKWHVRYGQYTTDIKNQQQVLALLP